MTRPFGGAEDADIYPRAKAAAEQALKLDPDMAEAAGVLAEAAPYYEWDWEKAERLFKRALELNPGLAMTHYHYAWYLALFDRLDEAIARSWRPPTRSIRVRCPGFVCAASAWMPCSTLLVSRNSCAG